MTLVTLDQIVRNFLLKRRYPLHYYIDFMVYAKDCLRTLSQDDLKIINTKILTVGSINEVQLPNDFLDYVTVGLKAGQNIKPLVESSKINRLENRSTTSFTPETYALNPVNAENQLYYGAVYPFYQMVSWNEYGEPTGRFFGYGAGVQDDVFRVIPERGVIQLTEALYAPEIVLEYISDGNDADTASRISPYAYDTIEAYIMWQMKEHSRTYHEGEKMRAEQAYIGQRRILRARLSDLTVERLKRIIQSASYGSAR
jgi:hypothetical protein